MADPNQTPPRGDWACPCAGCQKAVKWERKQLAVAIRYKACQSCTEGNKIHEECDIFLQIAKMIEDRK